jgi:tetratricopeptide (TPR) repeat protein
MAQEVPCMRKATALVAAVFVLSMVATWGQTPAPDLLAQARTAYDQRANGSQARGAVDLYAQAFKADPKSYAAAWEGARACYYYGHYVIPDQPDKILLALFQDGIDRARAAVALEPKGAEGHFWLGVLDGVYGETKGIFKSLSMVPEIKQEMQVSLDIDPAVEGYGPDRVLGRLYFKLPGFKGGDNKKSIEYLERSLKGAPTNALTKLYLAETCKSEGMKDKAIGQLKEILSMTPDPRWAPEQPKIKAEAEVLLRKLT